MTDTKRFIRSNAILLLVIAAGLIAGVVVLCARIGVERANKSYDIVADFQEIEAMARQSEEDIAWWLARFKEMDITKMGLAEESLNSLMRGYDLPVSAEVMDLLTQEADWRDAYPAEWMERIEAFPYDRYDVMVHMASKEAYDFVTEALLTRYGADRVLVFPNTSAYNAMARAMSAERYPFPAPEAEITGGYALIDGTPDLTLYTARYKKQNSKGGGFLELIDVVDSKLMYLSLGMLPEKVAAVQGAGMEVIPRTASYTGWNDERYARAVVADYARYGIVPSYLIVGGESVPGFDDGPAFIEAYLADNDIALGLIENTTQLQNILQHGVLDAAIASGYKAARIFSVWDYIQNRYQYYGYEGVEEIENTLFRAVAERNIRVIYYKPIREFKDLHTYVTEPDAYKTLFAGLDARLARHGFSRGEASVMPPLRVPFAAKLLIALSSAAAGILLLHLFFPLPQRFKYGLAAAGAICVLGAFKVLPYLTELIASFTNAFVFACLATIFFTSRCKLFYDRATALAAGATAPAASGEPARIRASAARPGALGPILLLASTTLAGTVLISVCGGILTAAPLSSINYMLEIDIFRGVKLSQLAPIAFFAVAYLAYFGFGNQKRKPGQLEFYDLKEMMHTPIRVWMVLVGLVFLGGGVYYILRTGHEVLDVSGTEMLLRNELEEFLIARPRTKEFLFAFPAVMLMVYTACRRFPFWPIVFGLCGVVGVTSVINTFMHIRTPLYLGFARTGYSLVFGWILGIVGILIFELLHRLYVRAEARRADLGRE
ncbi:MAG: DUF5693 family protein [Clostridiales Family XIII bacterium]|jgi:hypothetical protein|nr:DUF5693 family protein [Clostridiales Family XIII bacterium]